MPLKLPIHPKSHPLPPWYADGLNFTCTQCGNCCTGGPGFVWITREEIVRLAEFLNLSPEQTVERYCRKIGGQFSLIEKRGAGGSFDCVFLTEQPAKPRTDGKVSQPTRGCSIYSVRPLQCRTWPFWPENLGGKREWEVAGRKCPGMDTGRHFARESIEKIRDSKDWPDKPPSSSDKNSSGKKK
jgi:uncharacterized protein